MPARLMGVRRRFERWRQTRKPGTRIPKSLWAAAVKAAGQYGIHRAAKALSLDYYSLKDRTEGHPAGCRRSKDRPAERQPGKVRRAGSQRGEGRRAGGRRGKGASADGRRGKGQLVTAGSLPGQSSVTKAGAPAVDTTTFLELPSVACQKVREALRSSWGVVRECTIEWEDAGGAKMRVHFQGLAASDLAVVGRSFWGPVG
ncbi:MAG: hypothetical protein ABIK89_27150 [Planctomycetota bacterium]